MPRNGSGTFSLANPAFTPNTTISSSSVNSDLSDIATGLTGSVAANGETTITGQLKFPSGTAASPSHTFASDLTTGMYYPGAKQLSWSAGGVTGLNLNLNNAGVGQTGALLNYGNGAVLIPVGTVIDFASSVAPSGWLTCFGQAVSRTGYPELFQVIGTTYGSGDGSTTFNVPDCRGRATFGIDNGVANRITVAGGNFDGTLLANTGGAQNQTLTTGQMPSHTHTGTTAIQSAGHTHTVTAAINSGLTITPGAGTLRGVNADAAITSSGQSADHTHTFTTDATGSGSSHPQIPPAIILYKLIFAGRP